MIDEHVPGLLLSEAQTAAINRHGMMAWCTLFEILFDPEPDDEFKHYFPSIDVIIFSDGEWLVSYRILDNDDVLVANLIQDS